MPRWAVRSQTDTEDAVQIVADREASLTAGPVVQARRVVLERCGNLLADRLTQRDGRGLTFRNYGSREVSTETDADVADRGAARGLVERLEHGDLVLLILAGVFIAASAGLPVPMFSASREVALENSGVMITKSN